MKDKLAIGVLISALLLGIVGGSLVTGFQSPIVMDSAQRYAQVLRLDVPHATQPNLVGTAPPSVAPPIAAFR